MADDFGLKIGLEGEKEFKDGKFNGQGTYYFGDGRVWKGLWKDDQFVK